MKIIVFFSLIDITLKIHDENQKVLEKLYVQFREQILTFEGAVMVQTSGAFYMGHPVYSIYFLKMRVSSIYVGREHYYCQNTF